MGAIGESQDSGGRPSQQLQQMMQRGGRQTSLVSTVARDAYNRVLIVHYLDVLFFGAGFLLCTVTAYVLSKANYMASVHQCILNANWKLNFNGTFIVSGKEFEIDRSTGWGSEHLCNFVQFGNVACAIGGFILCWFFLLLKPYADGFHNRSGTSAAKLVPWVMLVSLAFTLVALIASIDMNMGFNEWCSNVERLNKDNIQTCSDVGKYSLRTSSSLSRIDIYAMMLAAVICSWCGFSCWMLAFLLVFVRFAFHMDFPSFFFEYEAIPETNWRSHSRKASSGPKSPLPVLHEVPPTKYSFS
uniref:Uncharacterized protein n=1 Tax=Plectus sambesii TaxID=2011161 RepID=A0A914W894_9BILA